MGKRTTVLSLGGSIINPGEPDVKFLSEFCATVKDWIRNNPGEHLVMVAGGGAPARLYQEAFEDAAINVHTRVDMDWLNDGKDWLGIMATRLNAQLLKEIFGDIWCKDAVVTDPEGDFEFTGNILMSGGSIPGHSSDHVAVTLAKRFGADTVINLSNIEKVYTDDPKTNPEAKPLDEISWADFREMVGSTWTPGMNKPFDPIAAELAEKAGIRVICAKGTNIENTMAILEGKEFVGTIIQ